MEAAQKDPKHDDSVAEETDIELEELVQEIAADAHNQRSSPSQLATYAASGTCVVCFENTVTAGVSIKACSRCDTIVCAECFFKFAQTRVEAALYAVPQIRCPSCLGRVRTCVCTAVFGLLSEPTRDVATQLMKKYAENASHMMTFRCAECHDTGSFLKKSPQTDPEAREKILRRVLAKLAKQDRSLEFDNGDISASTFVSRMMDMYWTAKPERSAVRDNPFVRPNKVQRFRKLVQQLFTDVERRVGFQLAFLCQYPKCKTECCSISMCFMCKISGWHRSKTCAQVQASQTIDAQFCPGCSVATVRTEGCTQITCVCGEQWSWAGDDDDDDDESEGYDSGYDEDESEEEDGDDEDEDEDGEEDEDESEDADESEDDDEDESDEDSEDEEVARRQNRSYLRSNDDSDVNSDQSDTESDDEDSSEGSDATSQSSSIEQSDDEETSSARNSASLNRQEPMSLNSSDQSDSEGSDEEASSSEQDMDIATDAAPRSNHKRCVVM